MLALQDRRSEGRVCGIILRSQLIVILLKSLYVENQRFWQPETTIQTFRDVYPRYPSISVSSSTNILFNSYNLSNSIVIFQSVRPLDRKTNYTVDLSMFMNPSPVRVNTVCKAVYYIAIYEI